MAALTFLQKVAFERGADVFFVKGKDNKQRLFYAFLRVSHDDIEKITRAKTRGLRIDLVENSQEILEFGWDEPPQEVLDRYQVA